MSTNQRLLLATVISMLFFMVYSAYFMPMPTTELKKTPKQEQLDNNAPTISTPKSSEQSTKAPIKINPSNISDTLVTINGGNFVIKIDNLGRIASKKLSKKSTGHTVELIGSTSAKPLELRFKNASINKEAFEVSYTTNNKNLNVTQKPAQVILTQTLSDSVITKTLTFYNDGHYDIRIDLSNDVRYFVSPGYEPKVNEYQMTVMGVLVQDATEQIHVVEDGDALGTESYRSVGLVSAFDRYYTTLFYTTKKDMVVVLSKTKDENPIAFVEGTKSLEISGYIGEKKYKILEAINPMLLSAIEYGFFTFISHPIFLVLQYLYDSVGNWGLAIILVTALIRLALFPLAQKGMVSMQKLKDVAPKMKDIKEKYKGDAQKMNAKMMEMYKKEGANPLGGCLPMLLQIPIFFAIYRVLLNSVELEGAPFILWIHDLSLMDPYYVFPILLGASMWFQQRISPNNFQDPMQEKIFKFLPIIFTFFFLMFPAGLTLYWFINNVFSITQQYMVNKQFEKMRIKKVKE
jgi:YidC/Oxa1 family membrane protein insertase